MVALSLNFLNELAPCLGFSHTQVDGGHELELPALSPDRRAVLAGSHLFILGVLLWRLQHLKPVSHTDLITDLPLPLKICGILMELVSILPAHTVDDQVVM